MNSYSKQRFIENIEDYLIGKISDRDLYSWNCGFLNISEEHSLLKKTWAIIHQLNETDPDIKTTEEELKYILKCLKGIEIFSEINLQLARDKGIEKRFKNLNYN